MKKNNVLVYPQRIKRIKYIDIVSIYHIGIVSIYQQLTKIIHN